jgi:hypothetical protein
MRYSEQHMTWQQANIQAAAAYLRERISAGAVDPKTIKVYEGLLEVLDPARRATRLQRESAQAAKAAVSVQVERDRRAQIERRAHRDRRVADLGPPGGVERRRTTERRRGSDRRNRG